MTHKKFAFRYEDLAAVFGFRLMKTVRESSRMQRAGRFLTVATTGEHLQESDTPEEARG
jgi:hypothetical protein